MIPINKNSSNTNNSETDLLQRLFVYGVGLQVYDLDTSVGELWYFFLYLYLTNKVCELELSKIFFYQVTKQ